MDTTYTVYICDLCSKAVEDESKMTVWVIDDVKCDVCSVCAAKTARALEELLEKKDAR